MPKIDEMQSAFEPFIAAGRLDLAADTEMLLAKSEWVLGRGVPAQEHADRALQSPSPTKAAVLVDRARLLMLAGMHGRANQLAGEGLAMAEELGLERLQASALITMGSTGGESPIQTLERGLELALRINDVQQIQRGCNNLAEELVRCGDVPAVFPLHEQRRRRLDRLVGPGLSLRIDSMQASFQYVVGDWSGAEPLPLA